MDDVGRPAPGGIGITALGRLLISVERDGEPHDLILQRRCGDAVHARAWCERAVLNLAPRAEVLEVSVLMESWRATHNWDRAARDAVTDSVQLGICGRDRQIRWSEPRNVSTGQPV